MVSELGLCVVLFARVEHKSVVGVDVVNLLATTSLILLRRHRAPPTGRPDRPADRARLLSLRTCAIEVSHE